MYLHDNCLVSDWGHHPVLFIVLTCCLDVGMWTVTGTDPFSRRDSMMLSPISPGFTPSTDITHTVTPEQDAQRERRNYISLSSTKASINLNEIRIWTRQESASTVYSSITGMCKPHIWLESNMKVDTFCWDQESIVFFTWGKVLNLLDKFLTLALGESRGVGGWEREDVLQLRQPLFGAVLGLIQTQRIHLVY